MNLVRIAVDQPVTIAVGVILVVMTGIVSLQRLPIQLTPQVDDTIVSVSTFWEGASPEEIEQEIIIPQEEKLQGLAGLREMSSSSSQSSAQIRLRFAIGMSVDEVMTKVSEKLREVPDYPDNVDQPIVADKDFENRDYIAWLVMGSTDPSFDVRTLQDFARDYIEPALERVSGVAETQALGGREREAQVRVDPVQLAQRGITPSQLVQALRTTNRNVSAGQIPDSKYNVRLRTVSQYDSIADVEKTVIAQTPSGPVLIGDVADVVETYKEPSTFVRSKGRPVIAINVQRELDSNVMEVMSELKAQVARLNEPGGILETHGARLGIDGELYLETVYDQTVYIDDAISLVRSNIWLGGSIAVFVLLIFLRSLRSLLIIAMAIPISVFGAVIVMVALGRTVNVISLAGMAFAVGMVVDNAIVVLENVFRHLEMGKSRARAAYDGAREVWGAVLAATLTTVVVFVPILMVQEEAGQLFRDIALAICAAVAISLVVSITVIPSAAAMILKPPKRRKDASRRGVSVLISSFIGYLSGTVVARLIVIVALTAVSVVGTMQLMPDADYLPSGNRNLVFGLMIPPPGLNVEQMSELGARVEESVRPYWEAADLEGTDAYDDAVAALPEVPTWSWFTMSPGDPVQPPPVENYFIVAFDGILFQGGVSTDPDRVVDLTPLLQHASRQEVIPGVNAFAFQVPLFQLGGSTGSAVKVSFAGDDLAAITAATAATMRRLRMEMPGAQIQADPGNFDVAGPEVQILPDLVRLADLGMTAADLAVAVQANGDGAIIGDYRVAGDTIDFKVIAGDAVERRVMPTMEDIPIATPAGHVVPLGTVATVRRTTSPPQINHVERQRSVSLQVTSPRGQPLEATTTAVQGVIDELRASGQIAPHVQTSFAGSASKLEEVRSVLLGDGTFLGTIASSLVMALSVVYLLMCVLFQSFVRPLVIMFSVPLATLGGFMALFAVMMWSFMDRYVPLQTLDVLTMLGFVILIGVVVNNAILIVHQTLNFMHGHADLGDGVREALEPRRAIAEAVRTRVRPILMSTLTSVGGMLPLVLMPGSGSELYRGLGSVVVGGLLVSTIFTIVLTPLLLSVVFDLERLFKRRPANAADTGVPSPVAAGAKAMRD